MKKIILSAKYQIVILKEIGKELKIKPGQKLHII
jgi:bifunctional DNA-binding transcriptional regulator/antitoxin component of YhaV-PrlF toxin-antitoxin module